MPNRIPLRNESMRRLTIFFIFSVIIIIPALALPGQPKAICQLQAKQAYDTYKNAKSTADSLKALINYYDMAPEQSLMAYDSISKIIIDLSLRSHNYDKGLDIIRQTAEKAMQNDSLLGAYINKTLLFPESANRKSAETYIKALKVQHVARATDKVTSHAELQTIISEFNTAPPTDAYDKILLLFSLVFQLKEVAPGDLLVSYTERLGNEINKLPANEYALRNLYLAQAALIYSSNDENEKAIKVDNELIKNIAQLERLNPTKGRPFIDYTYNKYLIYSRLLSNYRKLKPEQIEEYYKLINSLATKSPKVYDTYSQSRQADIFYAMAHKRYGEALGLLKSTINNQTNENSKRILLKEMITAANAVGDKDALLQASQAYNTILERVIEQRMADKVKELEIIYSINNLKLNHAKEASRLNRKTLIVTLIAAGILFVLLLFMLVMYRRRLLISRRLRISNQLLMENSKSLEKARDEISRSRDEAEKANKIKSDFIKNMSSEVSVPLHIIDEYTNLIVDCSDATDKPYLQQFSDLISYNSDLIRTIVSDLLNLSEIDSNTLDVSYRKIELLPLCRKAVESMKYRANKNVTLSLAPDLENLAIEVDPQRLSQILFQLLSNAVKFTESGSIILSYEAYPRENRVDILVSDTGSGINDEDVERVFDRFVKLDNTSQGVGIGLSLARQLARLLGGDIRIVKTNEYGSVFCVSIPIVQE